MTRISSLGMFTNLPTISDAADITQVGTTMADRIEKYVNLRYGTTGARDAAVSSPEEGMMAYIGAGDATEGPSYYHGSAWRPPWNAPWGLIGQISINADQTGISALTDITSATFTFTAVANRCYKISFTFNMTGVTATGNPDIKVFESAVDLGYVWRMSGLAAGTYVTASGSASITALSAGSRTLKLRAAQTGGGTLSILGASTMNGRYIVEDIGPTGGPA